MVLEQVVAGVLLVGVSALYWREHRRNQQLIQSAEAEQQQQQEKLSDLSRRFNDHAKDPVTGLLGFKLLEDRITQAIKDCARYKFVMGVMHVDIDNFQLINDAMGREAADQVLCEIGERLESCIRQVDSISRKNKDRFVVLLTQLARQETAVMVVQRMFQVLAEPIVVNNEQLSVTIGVGLSFYPTDGVTVADLSQHAEQALIKAKERGKNKYNFYQERLQNESQRELYLNNSMSSESCLNELDIVYQPIVNVAEQKIMCTEAQIVWNHPTVGKVSESELFMYAVQQGKLNEITLRTLKTATQKFMQWREVGLKTEMLAVSVALKQLEKTNFIYKISQTLQDNNFPPQSLLLEINHCDTPVSLDILEKSFNMLRYLGVKIAITDFGSGLFPLRYLNAFDVDYAKLDMSIISPVGGDEQSQRLAKAVVDFGAAMQIHLIASGVEEESQAEILKQLGIALQQGKLLGEPLSEQDMVGRMTSV